MAVIDRATRWGGRPVSLHQLSRRGNWADRNRGVVLVFVIVFIVGCTTLGLFFYRQWKARQADRAQYEVEEIKD